MPMIIKNGKRYCSTGGEAENVIYNNTNSSLDSTNVQDAIDELLGGWKIVVVDSLPAEESQVAGCIYLCKS